MEIYLRYLDTTIVIRQISARFFSIAVKIPQAIVNRTLAAAAAGDQSSLTQDMETNPFIPVQLCMKGCPASERIDYREILVQSHPVAPASSSSSRRDRSRMGDNRDGAVLQTTLVSRDVAEELCRRSHLLDYYLDSCVYDLMSTGDANYSHAVRLAQSDEFRLVPTLIQQHNNRTLLDTKHIDAFEGTKSRTGGGGRGGGRNDHGDKSSSAGTSMHFLNKYLTSFSILILSHLNYMHRTTFVLIG